MERHHIQRAIARLATIPHLNHGYYPTPIEELSRLRKALGGGPRLLIKRDDYTGPGFGGNKVRKLEYLLAQVVADGTEIAITTGGERSNHARVTAALCARLGLSSILVLNRASPAASSRLKPASLYLDEMLGAEIHYVNSRQERAEVAAAIVEQLRREGKRVTEIPIGASVPLGALGFVKAVQETAAQLQAMNVRPNYIFHASSSGGTQAGIVAGCQLFGLDDAQVIGVSPDDPAAAISTRIARIIDGVGELLGLPAGALNGEATVLDSFIGPGYGLDTPEAVAAMRLLARAEGILLDPVYTAKAMAALIAWVRQGQLTEQDTVLFWHTGGQLAMFYAPIQEEE
ncbi:MAG: 1-aminocyclopropane-1-carboxylate deaminase/D-cysteine desulfhydrase [Blastocatellia bacterium]